MPSNSVSYTLPFDVANVRPEPESGMVFLGWVHPFVSTHEIILRRERLLPVPLTIGAIPYRLVAALTVATSKFKALSAVVIYRREPYPVGAQHFKEVLACFREATPTELLTGAV